MEDSRIDNRKSKNYRTINMYVRFCEGKTINKTEEAQRFGVDERSIQRDIDDIRAFLDERRIGSKDTIEYDRTKKSFIMTGAEPTMMTTVKNTCIDVMKISKGEEDRVICVGEYENETDNERWIVELKRAIEKYCNSIETARKNCTQYIYEIIEDELRPELSAIKDALGSDTGDMLESHLENSSYLKAFDQVVNDRRKKIETKLDSTLDKSFISSRDRLEKIFSDSSYAKELGVKDERIIRRTVFR